MLKIRNPAYRGGKRSVRKKSICYRSGSACVSRPSPRRPDLERPSGAILSSRSSEFLCKRILSAAAQWHPEPFSASLNQAPRSEWKVAGRGGRALGCPVTATRRAALAAPARRPAGWLQPPCTLGRISAGREAPPRARPQEGGREPRGRGRPRDARPGDAGMRCSRLGDPRSSSALPGPRWNEPLTGCAPRFLFVTGHSWKAYRLCLAVNIKSAKQFFYFYFLEISLHPFKAKRSVFKRA